MRTFGTIEWRDKSDEKGGAAAWSLKVEPHVAMRLKRMFLRIGDQFGSIVIKDSDEVCRDLAWFMDRYPLEMSAEDRARLEGEAAVFDQRTADFTSILQGKLDPRPFEMALPPRDYQAIATELALRTRGLLCADDLGLGKTCVGIAMLTDPATRPALVVTMTHLPKQWEKEMNRFMPDLRVHVVTKSTFYDIAEAMDPVYAKRKTKERGGPPKKMSPTKRAMMFVREQLELELGRPEFPDVVVMNYHKLSGWSDALAPIMKGIIFDECQELRRSDSNKYRAARHLAREADYVLGLSATPVYNRGGEIYNIMEVLRPDCLGTWSEFGAEWCGSKWADRAKASVREPKAFGTYLRENGLMIRRTRKDVGRELPPLVKVPHYVESDPAALDKIEADVAELARRVLATNTSRIERRDAAGELDWKLRHATGVGKAPYVGDFVKMLIESEVKKVLMFGWHRDVYEIWKSKLKAYNPAMYTGSESTVQKAKSFDRFNDPDSDCKVMMMSLRSGAGLDGLQDGICTTAVIGELDWSPAVHDQGIGRLHRDGQDQVVTAYFMLSDEGSDPVISDVLGLKRVQIEGVQNPDGDIIEKVDSGDSRIKKLAEELLRKRGDHLAVAHS